MPSKSPLVPLRDIRDNIRLAQSFVEGFQLVEQELLQRKSERPKRSSRRLTICAGLAVVHMPLDLTRRSPLIPAASRPDGRCRAARLCGQKRAVEESPGSRD